MQIFWFWIDMFVCENQIIWYPHASPLCSDRDVNSCLFVSSVWLAPQCIYIYIYVSWRGLVAHVFCLLLQRKATCKAKGKKKEQDTLVTWNFEPADFQPRTRQEILKLAAVSLSDMVRESVWLGSMAGKPGLEGGSWGGWEEGNRRRVRDRLRKTQQSWSCVHLHLWLANCNFHTLTIAHTGVDFYLDSSPVCDETQSRRSDRGAENVHWVSNILIILWDTDFSCFFLNAHVNIHICI